MKIAFLNIYNGLVERGSEVFVQEMANRLAGHHKVSVFQTGVNRGQKYTVKRITGIPLAPHQENPGLKNKLYHFWVLLFTLKALPYLWRDRYDWIIPVNGRWQ